MTLDDVKAAATPGRKSKTSTATWNSRMGPEKNVRWRGGTPPAPPAWKYDVTDLRAFSKWARKIEIWRVQISSYMTSREASLLLYTSLTGEAEAELEHAPLEKINHETGIDYILETLKAPMEQKAVYQKRKFLADFEQLNRYPGEGLRTFANRYRRVERSLEALGMNITGMYDAEARGNRLLERARLTLQDQRLILVGARYSLAFDDIADSMVLQYPEFKTAPPVVNKDGTLATRPPAGPRDRPGKGNSQPGQPAPSKGHYHNRDRQPFPPKKVFLAEQTPELEHIDEEDTHQEPDVLDEPDGGQDDDVDEPPGQDDDDGDGPDLDEVAEAKRLSGLKLGRKFTGGPRKDTAALKRETHCQACGEKGHWKGDPECPMTAKTGPSHAKAGPPHGRPGPSVAAPSSAQTATTRTDKPKKPHQTFFIRDAGTYEATNDQEYGSLFQVRVVFKVQAKPGETKDFARMMVLDTACQRTCCGLEWELPWQAAPRARPLRPQGAMHRQLPVWTGRSAESGKAVLPAGWPWRQRLDHWSWRCGCRNSSPCLQ